MVGQHGDRVADRRARLVRPGDPARPRPVRAAVSGAREVGALVVAGPREVRRAADRRVRGDRRVVARPGAERPERPRDDHGERPGVPSVGGVVDDDARKRLAEAIEVTRHAGEERASIWAKGQRRVAVAVAAARRTPADPGNRASPPRAPAVHGGAHAQREAAAARVAILLPGGDEPSWIGRIGDEIRLYLGAVLRRVGEVAAPTSGDQSDSGTRPSAATNATP